MCFMITKSQLSVNAIESFVSEMFQEFMMAADLILDIHPLYPHSNGHSGQKLS